MTNPFHIPLDAGRHSGFTTPLRLLLATTAAFWMGTVQPQVVPPAATRHTSELRFRDFFRAATGPIGLDISDTLRQADGQSVRLMGYMVQQEGATPGCFLLTPRPLQLGVPADHAATDLPPATVLVTLDPAQQDWAVPHVQGLVAVRGKLSIGRHEAIDGRVSRVRLQLDPDAVRSMDASELTGYLHRRRTFASSNLRAGTLG